MQMALRCDTTATVPARANGPSRRWEAGRPAKGPAYARALTNARPTAAPAPTPTTPTPTTPAPAEVDPPNAQLTLGRLVEQLGSGVLDVVVAPAGLDVAGGQPAIHDPTEPLRAERNDVILAVAVRPADPAAAELVRHAGGAGATAVLLKTPDPAPPDLLQAAEEVGVAILAAPPEITWSQLHALMRTAIASSGSGSDTGTGRVPLGDLFALANAVSAMVGGPTTIEDPKSRVLAYSSLEDVIDEPRRRTILGRRVPDEWISVLNAQGVFRQLWSTRDVVHVANLTGDGSVRPRMAIAVRAGDEILGSIWVAEGDKPLDASSADALRRAAEIAALHIVRNRAGDDIERHIRGEQLRNIIEGRGPL